MSTPQRDYYEVLGVAREADAKAIKNAFRELALMYHPDRNKEPGAEERFKEIAEAYAILSDPKKRADYDARGFAGVAGFSREDLFGGIHFEDIFSGMDVDWGGDHLFDHFFHRKPRGPARGANVEVDVSVPLACIASGGNVQVHLTRPAPCPVCQGTGESGGAAAPQCAACQGEGRITHTRRDDKAHVLIQHVTPCVVCHGAGFVHQHPCESCHGEGDIVQDESLTVKIPIGAEEGLMLRMAGKGMPSPEPGGTTGDLIAVVRTEPDPRFERVGADLVQQHTLSVTQAVLGTTLTVPTLQDAVSVVVPPGTQPGTVLRLANKGLPGFEHAPQGDMYVRISIQVPEHLSPKARELFEKLHALEAPATVPSHVHVGT